jgi:hypothetical protein
MFFKEKSKTKQNKATSTGVSIYLGCSDRKLNIIHSKLRNMCKSVSADL